MREKKLINISIGERIKIQRERAGLTQERFAEILDISPNHISDIERGISGVSLETLKNICDVLCLSADQLIMGERDENEVEWIAARMKNLDPVYFDKLVGIINCYLEAVAINSRS